MFLERNHDADVDTDEPIAGGNFGSVDFGEQVQELPDWLDLDEDTFLTPGTIKEEAEAEESVNFLTDTPRDAYTDRATREVIEFDDRMNPTFVVGREYLLSDKSDLIRDGATLLQDVMRSLQPVVFSRQPNLTRIVTDDVQANGHVRSGSLIWSVEISAANQPGIHWTRQSTPIRKTRIEIPMKIREGSLIPPKIFTNSSNKFFPLTIAGCKVILKWKADPVSRSRPPRVDLAQTQERDYRAF